MGLLSFFRRIGQDDDAIVALYAAVVQQARSPAFYAQLGVPDTVDGRFDLIIMHTMLAMRRLRSEGQPGEDLAPGLLNYMFKDMDRSLREIGVGDMSVGKHIKKMAKAFYGRSEEYEKGIDGSATALNDALSQNLFRKHIATEPQLAAMRAYLLSADQALRALSMADIAAGRMVWPNVTV